MTSAQSNFLSVPEAAQRAGVSVKTVYNWAERGLIHFHKRAGGRRRVFVDVAELERVLTVDTEGGKA